MKPDDRIKKRWLCLMQCSVCGAEQLRGYDKKPFDYGSGVKIAMICKGACRRPPASEREREAIAGKPMGYPVWLGPADGQVPQTTNHRLVRISFQGQDNPTP